MRVQAGYSLAKWPDCYIDVRHGGGLSVVFLRLKDAWEIFVKRREFLPVFLSCRGMT